MALAHLRQFMPPRTLEESLRVLIDSGMLDVVETKSQRLRSSGNTAR